MALKSNDGAGLLASLRHDMSGNVLAISAAALIPLTAIVGSGVDMSRAYLTRTRLQQACDAGVLAGRKVMGSTGARSTAVDTALRDYVRFNLPQEIAGQFTNDASIDPEVGANDELNLTLSTTLDTTVMQLFGKENFALSVNCSARNDYSNIDIVLVLDTTGSMACSTARDSSDCSNWINGSGLYRNNGSQNDKTMQVGGKTVTYVNEEKDGSNVNISRMQVLRTALASFKTQMSVIEQQFATASADTRKRIRYAVVPFSQMVNAGLSIGSNGTTLYSRKPEWFNDTLCTAASSASCRTSNTTTHTTNWINNTWDGCVEERPTINTITPSNTYSMVGPSKNLPAAAYDLQIDDTPSGDTRWTMADKNLISGQYACPRAMRELQETSNDTFNNYFAFNQGFVANGGTYLDIGLIWAARLLSRSGLWSADNPATHNGWPVSRYVIFMTDGHMDTGNSGYGAYRPESTYKRITSNGNATTSNDNHTARWQMTCSAIKNMNTKIFVISFSAGSTLTNDMISCSSGSGYNFRAADSTSLQTAFRNIGNSIGALRLSQ